ncbi:MAG: TIM-barrel domain-containing protein, partial [Candidatus Methylumidiphilus sp.]
MIEISTDLRAKSGKFNNMNRSTIFANLAILVLAITNSAMAQADALPTTTCNLHALNHGDRVMQLDQPVLSGADVAFVATELKPATNRPAGKLDAEVILPPAWAFGVLYGFYTNQDGILKNFHRLETGDFPVDAIWEDSAFWDVSTRGPRGYLDFKGDRTAFPDLAKLTVELHLADFRFADPNAPRER